MKSFFYDVLGLQTATASENTGETDALNAAMQLIIDLRATARADRDFSTSDKIRDDLANAGIQLKDGVDGTTYSLK